MMTTRTRIKICGLTREADVVAAVAAGADAVGFVLYEQSPRYVTPVRVFALARELPPFVTPVLLFVNPTRQSVQEGLSAVPNALLQFHGDETAEQCKSYQRPYIKALRMQASSDLLHFSQLYSSAKAILLDHFVEGYGGGGKVFDWSLIPPNVNHQIVLSGGLTPANVIDGITQLRPRVDKNKSLAVDVSSGVEVSKGVKSAELMHQFCQAVRRADALWEAQYKAPSQAL
jgi:phosphoribosylanthranilate isomerase